MEVEAADDAELLIEIAFGVKVSAKTGAYTRKCAEPVYLLGFEIVFLISEVDLDLVMILVGEQFFHAIVQLQDRGNEDKPLAGESNDLLEIIIRRAGIQELRHNF